MTPQERAERLTESLEYFSPVWYTLSGEARVCARSGRWRAEVRVSGAWAIINGATFAKIADAMQLAVRTDRFAEAA